MPVDQVRKRSPISSLVLTFGCKFACPYCPIPAYNQRQYRVKSGERIAEEIWRLNQDYRFDRKALATAPIDDGVLKFDRVDAHAERQLEAAE